MAAAASEYVEIESGLRFRGMDEPSRDLDTLKQILEALQLKGLLHSASGGRNHIGYNSHSPAPSPRRRPSPSPSPITTARNESNAIGRKSNSLVKPKPVSVETQPSPSKTGEPLWFSHLFYEDVPLRSIKFSVENPPNSNLIPVLPHQPVTAVSCLRLASPSECLWFQTSPEHRWNRGWLRRRSSLKVVAAELGGGGGGMVPGRGHQQNYLASIDEAKGLWADPTRGNRNPKS
ncbi:TUDOR-SN protein 1 [Striga asiatica]|uniref:TUDOR-SN protein 1 n=1 Tax=Striga asiatica TaxID=4170 RepID=A0A5A7R9R3_STRAF|nr:TUDOR-SN protein 1 [Striga asiatica]